MPAPMNLETLVIQASKSILMSSTPVVSHKVLFNSRWGMCLINSGVWRMTGLVITYKKLLNFQLAHRDSYRVNEGKLCGSAEWFNSVSFSTHWLGRKSRKHGKDILLTHSTLPLKGRKIWWWNQSAQWGASILSVSTLLFHLTETKLWLSVGSLLLCSVFHFEQ